MRTDVAQPKERIQARMARRQIPRELVRLTMWGRADECDCRVLNRRDRQRLFEELRELAA